MDSVTPSKILTFGCLTVNNKCITWNTPLQDVNNRSQVNSSLVPVSIVIRQYTHNVLSKCHNMYCKIKLYKICSSLIYLQFDYVAVWNWFHREAPRFVSFGLDCLIWGRLSPAFISTEGLTPDGVLQSIHHLIFGDTWTVWGEPAIAWSLNSELFAATPKRQKRL